MHKFIIAGIMLVSVPFVSFAQTSTTTPVPATGTITITNPGLAPGDFFYFLDRWSEALNLAITFNKEKKARTHLEYAKERVAEIGEVLKNPEAKLEDVKSAKDNFGTQVADAAGLLKGETGKGKMLVNIALEFDDELDGIRDELKNILKEHKDKASRAEEVIRAKLASLSPTDPQVQGLTQALESITKEKDDTAKEEEGVDDDLEDEQAIFEEIMGKELSAQKHFEQAMRLRDRMKQGLPEDFATSSEKLMRDAQDAMKRGDFESAKRMSKEAERALEKAQEMRGNLEAGMPSLDGMMEIYYEDAGESHVGDLEAEIKNAEKMMEDLGR